MICAIRDRINLNSLRAFFMSDIYPIFICAITVIGSVSGIEFYLAILHIVLVCAALIISRSIRPILISLLTFVMQLSLEHSPFYPNYSDYYYTGWRLIAVFAMGIAVFSAILYFIIKNKIYRRISFKRTPILLAVLLLSAAFLTNGVFSAKWERGDLIFGFANAVVYSIVFLLVYHGFSEEESSDSIAKYFSFLSMLIAFVIILELAALFLTNENMFVDGSINKTEVALGWGMWTVLGSSLAVLIPAIFYGIGVNRYPWLYFAAATLTLIFAALTMSRNALLFGGIAYAACVLIYCFKGKRKKEFRVITAIGILFIIAGVIVFWDAIYSLLSDYFNRGTELNGREVLWPAAIRNFLDFPIFGAGFYGLDVTTDFSYGPLALQAHNTVLQLLSATGAVGLLAYLYYRFCTLKPVFSRPTLKKTFMAMSIGVLLLGSLLDNFIFFIYPTFHYTVALSVIFKENEEQIKIK